MNRLVYSPKAYAFVRTDATANGKPPFLDITDYIVRGNVSRVVGAASTATLTLRNPDKIWNTTGKPVFHPMDPITIYLSRYKQYPVQVFTGYLDKTPYLQLFPGTVTLTASCTLKKLLHTYWDPALPFSREFMEKLGWFQDPQTGQMQNLSAQAQNVGDGALNDGSIGNVLYSVLTEPRLGNWNDNEVFIEQLPANIVTSMKKLYKALETDATELENQLTNLLSTVIGGGSYGSGTGSLGAETGGTGNGPIAMSGNVTGLDKIIPTIIKIANSYNVPPEMAIAVCIIESGLGKNMHRPGARYYGWYQIDIHGSRYSKPITIEQANDLSYSCNLFCRGAIDTVPKSVRGKPYLEWAMATQGVNGTNNPLYPQEWSSSIATALQYMTTYATKSPTAKSSSVESEDTGASPDSQSVSSTKSPPSQTKTDTKIYAPIAGGSTTISSPFGEQNHGTPPHTHMGIDVPVPTGTDCIAPVDGRIGQFASASYNFGGAGGMVHFIFPSDVGDVKAGTVIGWGHVKEVLVKAGDTVRAGQVIAKSNHPAPHVHFIQRTDDADMDGTVDPTPLFKALQAGKTSPTAGAADTGATSSDTPVLDNSTAAAFATQLEWPSVEESIEAIALQGQKSLMNDQQLMPFVQQLVSGSLRQFQSLPNGDFFAFFPDYFGDLNHRKPYWYIDDIEIIDGKIELTDDALATHVYTVGDTGVPFDGVNFIDKILSGGVVTIFNAFESEFVKGSGVTKDGKSKLLASKADAVKFLQKYGARPYYEEIPAIRSPYYESFYAFQTFQLLWSRTFLTEFQLTFMPELYPGGIVAFKEHHLQCYIDSVSHDFDYESGFTTTAQLSAPASLDESDPLGLSQGLVRANPLS